MSLKPTNGNVTDRFRNMNFKLGKAFVTAEDLWES